MLRVLQVGLGPLGRRMVADLHGRGLGVVVGAVDVDPDLRGKALTELVGGVASDVRVVASIDDLDGGRAGGEPTCAIVTTSSWLDRCEGTFRALLERGLAVVSTCEELVFPWLKSAALAHELDAQARERGGRLLGAGVNPGFLMDALPLIASAVCRTVESIDVARVQDASLRRLPFQHKIGTGMSVAEFAARAREGRFGHAGLEQSLHFLAHYLGFAFERTGGTLEPLIAEREHASGLGPVAPGAVRGLRQVAWGEDGRGRRIRLEFVAAVGVADPRDSVTIAGEPPVELVWRGGVHGDIATVSLVLNALPSLLAAPPGLHTMASIPPAHWRAGG